jgi:hypothetical protein
MFVWVNFAVAFMLSVPAAAAANGSRHGQLDGEWRLVSSEQVKRDGTRGPSPLYGPDGVGFLVLAQPDEVCAVMTSPSPEGGLNAYCGKYELNEAQRYIIIDIVVDAVPNDLGAGLKRYVSIDSDVLTLRTENPGPDVEEYTLTWRRLPPVSRAERGNK